MPFDKNFLAVGFASWTLFTAASLPAAGKEFFCEPWGRDSALRHPVQEKQSPHLSIPTRVADAIIRFHQQVISPVDGPRSHFRPTSSRYMQLAMHRYGFLQGFFMGCDRLLRENDEEWVYRTIQIEGRTFKYDPAWMDKHTGLEKMTF